MTDYTNFHLKNCMRRFPQNVSKIQKGMILNFTYVSEGSGKKVDDIVMVLNPKYRFPGEDNWKVHALKINALPPKELNLLADRLGMSYILGLQKTKRIDVPMLLQEVSSKRFYFSDVKKLLKRYQCYRTYIIPNIQKCDIIDYKFDKDIEYKYLKDIQPLELTTKSRHNIGDIGEKVSDEERQAKIEKIAEKGNLDNKFKK